MAGKKRKKAIDLTESEWSLGLTSPSRHPMAQDLDFFFDFAQEVYAILDGEKVIQRLNQRFGQILGWEPADYVGAPFANLLPANETETVLDILTDVATQALASEFDCQCVTASGRQLAMHWRASAQANGMLYLAGHPVDRFAAPELAATGGDNDITLLIAQLEPALPEAKVSVTGADSYRTLFEQFSEPLFIYSDEGFVEANGAGLALLGVSDSESLQDRRLPDYSPVVQSDNQVSHEKFAAQIARLAAGGVVKFAWEIADSGGRTIPLTLQLSELGDHYLLRSINSGPDEELRASLDRRVNELSILADVAGAIAKYQNPTLLLDHIVDMIKDRFEVYHTQIYLYDEFNNRLRLAAGAGEEGAQLVGQGVEISLTDPDYLIAHVGLNQVPRMVLDIHEDNAFTPLAVLPQTRVEMALPIMVDDYLLGVLDLQCLTLGRFEKEDQAVYESLAVLIGVALQNARIIDEAVRSRQQLARLSTESGEKRRPDRNSIRTRAQFEFVGDDLLDFAAGENTAAREPRLIERGLRLQDNELGAITIVDPQSDDDDADLIVDAVLTSLSAHLENLRLTEQTEEALGETELLYHVSARLNAASSLAEVFQAVLESGVGQEMASATLFMLELDEHGQPEYAVVSAHWQEADIQQELPPAPVGHRFYLPDLPTSSLWVEQKDDIVIVADIMNDHRVDAATRKLFEDLDLRRLVVLPLVYRGRWIGLLRLTWVTPQEFAANEQRVYRALTVQMTTAVNNLMLLDESQIRAAQLEKLSQAETDLSLANDEDAILLALVRQLPSRWLRKATLSYLDDTSTELMQQAVSYWTPEGFSIDTLPGLEHEPVNQNGLAQLWLQYPGEVLNIADVETDYRVPPAIKVMAAEERWSAVTILPLRSGNRWQGLIALYWAEAFELTDDQYFLFDRLMEPVAAVVASRRAQLEQQQAEAAERVARRETESLYNASRKINEAETLATVLAATVESAGVTDFTSGVIVVFDKETDEGELAVQVVANWYGGKGRRPDEVGLRHVLYSPIAAEFLMPDDIIFIENLQTDARVPLQVRSNFFGRQGAEALLLLPLMAGGRQLGAMMLTSESPHPFSDRERRVFASLAPQIAIAIQNRSLLEDAQARARRERILREITAQVRSSNDVDTILRIAAEQVGKAFGRPTFVSLDDKIQQTE